MKGTSKLLVGLLSLAMLGAFSGSAAEAQCGGPAKKVMFNLHPLMSGGSLKLAAFHEDRNDGWGDERDRDGLEPIVGLWKVAFVDKSKNYSDTAYVVWHSDFTEFQNSERTPSTGAVCQGVWQKVGHSTYRLNHYALAYGDNVNLTNVIRIREEVVVDKSRQSFSGTFTTDIYDTGHNLLVEFNGPVTGKRVTINSSIDSQ